MALRSEGSVLVHAATAAVLIVALAIYWIWKSAQPERDCLRQGPPVYIKIGWAMYPVENCEEYAP